MSRCDTFVKNIQSDDVDVRVSEVSSFSEYLSEMVSEGRAPLHELGQGVCSNILYLLITKHVQPLLAAKSSVGKGKTSANSIEKLNELVTLPFVSIFESVHNLIPANYPIPPLLWKSSGALRKILEHIFVVLESDSLLLKCGHVYCNLLRYLLRFEAYQDVLSSLEVNRAVRRLIAILSNSSQAAVHSLNLASAQLLSVLMSSPITFQHLEEKEGIVGALCQLTNNFHTDGERSGTSQLHSDLKVQASLVRSVRILTQGLQYDQGARCTGQATVLVKPLLCLWHRSAKRDEWRAEVIHFVLGQLTFLFSSTLACERRGGKECEEIDSQHLLWLHNDVVPLLESTFFPSRREQEYDGSGRLRVFPSSPSMGHFVDLFSLTTFLSGSTFKRYVQLSGDASGESSTSPFLRTVASSIIQLPIDLMNGARLNELKDSALIVLHGLGNPLSGSGMSGEFVEEVGTRLLSCFPSASTMLDVGLLAALSPLWRKCSIKLLRMAWASIAPALFPSRGLLIPCETSCSSLLCVLHALRAQGVFDLPSVEGFELSKCSILNLQQDQSDGSFFRPYLADFFVEALCFSLSPSNSTKAIPPLSAAQLTAYLAHGYSGLAGSRLLWVSSIREGGSANRTGQSLYKISADVVDSITGPSEIARRWSNRATGDVGLRTFEPSALLNSILYSPTHVSPLIRFFQHESARSKLRSLGKGSLGEKSRSAFENKLTEFSRLQLGIWRSVSPRTTPTIRYSYAIPRPAFEATAVLSLFTNDEQEVTDFGAGGTLWLGSNLIAQTIYEWSQDAIESLSCAFERQEQFEESCTITGSAFEISCLSSTPSKMLYYIREAVSSILRGSLTLRCLMLLRRSGVWQFSSDEDDARVLLERSYLCRSTRDECFRLLTPNGGITLVSSLLMRLLDAQLRRFDVSILLDGSAAHVASTVECFDSLLSGIELLVSAVGADLCEHEFLSWDPQRAGSTSLKNILFWLSSTLEKMLSVSSSSNFRNVLLSAESKKAVRLHSVSGHSTGIMSIGSAAASIVEVEGSVRYPVLHSLVRCIERTCTVLGSMHLEVQRHLVDEEAHASLFAPLLIDEQQILSFLFRVYYTGGLLPNSSNFNPSAHATPGANPFRAGQFSPIALLETVDAVALLVGTFSRNSASSAFSLFHDMVYVIRCLYSDSHLCSIVRIVETLCKESSHIIQPEWGAGVLKGLLEPTSASSSPVRFLSASAFVDCSDVSVCPSTVGLETSVPPLRWDFVLTDCHRSEICRAQATVMLRCQGKRWGVGVGRSLFSACSGNASFGVRREAASYVSLPFKLYQRNLVGVLGELLEQVRSNDYFERSRCATSLLAVASACRFAPSIEGDVVSFMLEVYATRGFVHKRIVLDALTYILGYRERTQIEELGDLLEPEEHRNASSILEDAHNAAQTDCGGSSPYARLTRAHLVRICFDWIWCHGHSLISLPFQCFGYATIDSFIVANIGHILPIAVLAMHKTRSSLGSTGTSAYLQPQTLNGGEANLVDAHDSSAIDSVNNIMRSYSDLNSLIREHFASIASFLILLSKCSDDGGTRASPGSTLQDFRVSAEKSLAWLRVQIGSELFNELCRRNPELIVVRSLERCRDSMPLLPFVSFKVVCGGISVLCEIIDVPNFPALMTANNGDRALIILTSMYRRLCLVPPGEAPEVLRAIQGLLTGLFGQPCLRIPLVLEAAIRILCYVIHSFPSLRIITCETFRSVWAALSELKDGVALLQPHFQLVSSFLSASSARSTEVFDCLKLVVGTFAGEGADEGDSTQRRRGGNAQGPSLRDCYHFAEPSQGALGPSPGAKRPRSSESSPEESSVPSAGQALHSVFSVPSVLTRLGATSPPPSFFKSVSKAVDSQGLFFQNAIIEEVIAKEMARRYSGASPEFVRQEQLAVAMRVSKLAGCNELGTGESTVTEILQRSSRHLFLICSRSDIPMAARTAALDALRSIVRCLVEGCATEELSAIDFAPSSTALLEVMDNEKASQVTGVGRSWTRLNFATHSLEENIYHLYCRLLSQVRALTVDTDPAVMMVAGSVLRNVCAEVVGSDTLLATSMCFLRDHYSDEYAKIKPFRREHGTGRNARGEAFFGWDRGATTPGLSDLISSFPPIPSEELWGSARSRPDHFTRALSTILLKDHAVPHFPFLAPFVSLTALHGGFAEMYLPLIFLHISMRRPTEEKERLRKFLATNIDAILRNKDTPVRVSRLLLSSINFLRGARTSIIKQFGIYDPTQGHNTATNEDEKRREKAAKEARHELEKLNKTSLAGYRDRISDVKDSLWFPTEHLSLTTLVSACARCDEWALCLMFTELCFDGIDGTPGLSATVVYSVGSTSVFCGDGSTPMGGASSGHTTRKMAKVQRLQHVVRTTHEAVGPLLLQCAERLRDGGLLRQLLFTHRSSLTGYSSAVSASAQARALASTLRCQRNVLLDNATAAMQLDERGRGSLCAAPGRSRQNLIPENAVRAPKDNSLLPSFAMEDFQLNYGQITSAVLKHVGCPSASLAVAREANLSEAASEAAWRCSRWDEIDSRGKRELNETDDRYSVHTAVYSSLRNVYVNDAALASTAAAEGMESIINSMNPFNVVENCLFAQGLRDIVLFGRLARDRSGLVSKSPSWLVHGDSKSDILSGRLQEMEAFRRSRAVCAEFANGLPSFRTIEPLLAIRSALCGMGMPDEWSASYLSNVASEAASSGYPYTAMQWVDTFIQRCQSPSVLTGAAFAVGRALLLSSTGDTENAMQVLSDLPTLSSSNQALALLGAWTARYQHVPLHKLVREPLMRQMTMDGAHYNSSNMYLFASWCDSLMREVKENLSSRNAMSTIAGFKSLETRAPEGNTRDGKAFDVIQKEITAANVMLQSLRSDLDIYCDTTIIGYASSLIGNGASNSDGGNDLHAIYRILHHWLGESSSTFSPTAQERISQIPPIKFLPVFPQLVVRVVTVAEQRRVAEHSEAQAESYELIRKVVFSCLELYPTHCLWYVFSLRQSADAAKAEAAHELIAHVAGLRHLKGLVLQMATMVDGYVQQGSVSKERDGQIEGKTLPVLIESAARSPSVPVPTVPTRLVPFNLTAGSNALTSHQNGYQSIAGTYKILGGISKPRLVTITMVSGFMTRQIVKGNDDLRQDAVIQQVFSLSCTLLGMRSGGTGAVAAAGLRGDSLASLPQTRSRPSTGSLSGLSNWDDRSQRRLYMRTYSVVPIGPGCGLIQFLDSALSLAEYLADETLGVHRRYFPKELTSNQCRALLTRSRGQSVTVNGKPFRSAYDEVCEGFSPAMHYFYSEHFVSPKQWLEARDRYVTSAAVSSIVGFVVGLGDRHASNVMIDKESAEIIHIDLGISFDQGQLLPIPEEVPFRLTRDMVDGMGVFGVEGSYRQICEQTLYTMRENRQLLTAVVETFVYDPLARWSIEVVDNDQSAHSQEGTRRRVTKSTPVKAHSVLRKTEDKLRGLESGEILGVPNQVQMLIQKATDPENLCKMFQGWSAWL